MKLSRREVLTVPLGLAAIAAGLVTVRRTWSDRANSLEDLATIYPAIARAYVATEPEELDEGRLFQALFGHLEDPSSSDMVKVVREASRRDFEEGQTFAARGWVLSRTAGRLAALACLQYGLDLGS